MIMIPLHYLIALTALFFVVRGFVDFSREERNHVFLAFLMALALQAVIVGTRFGYGVDWLQKVQPVTAALLPPLAYLAFRERVSATRAALFLLLPVLALVIGMFLARYLDAFLALNNLIFGALLARIGLRGSDGLPWAGINRVRNWLLILWIIVVLLIYSGITDSVIFIDFMLTEGRNTENIVAIASIIGVVGTALAGWFARLYRPEQTPGSSPDERHRNQELFARIDGFMREGRLYLDPDLNLNRIARRLTLPSREVSQAINSQTGQNVSQYVNGLRIAEACRLMDAGGENVTNAIYASGFNTKSNFNREFLRVMGKSPSQWRRELPENEG